MAASSAEMRRPERGEGETILHDPLTILNRLMQPPGRLSKKINQETVRG
jgi:hypothetical protein